jgi:hypothetical protein
MKKYLTFKNILIAVLIVVGVGLFIDGCRTSQKLEKTKNELTLANLKFKEVDSIKNVLGQKVYTQEVTITENQEVIKQLADEKFQLQNKYERKIKETIFFYEAKLNLKADTVLIPYPVDNTDVSAYTSLDSLKRYVRDSTIRVPKHVELSDSASEYKKGLRFDADITKQGFKINTVGFVDTQYIRIDKKKRNFWKFITFKPKTYEVKVLHTSPYLNVEGQKSLLYIDKPKGRLLKTIIPIGVGILIGTKL